MESALLNEEAEEREQAPYLHRSKCCSLLQRLASFITIFTWIQKVDFRRDLVAGLTVGVMAVPQAMSYATVAGLPAQYGLYNAFMGLLPYCIFGTSPHLISGPTAVMSILVAGLIPNSLEVPDTSAADNFRHVALSCSNPNSEGCQLRIAVALTLSLLAGFFQLALGLFRLGFITNLISDPIIVGFTTGSAFLIASTQFTNILGISKSSGNDPWACNAGFLADGFQGKVCNVIHKLIDGDASWQTMVLGAICILVLYIFKYQMRSRLPKFLSVLGNLGPLTIMIVLIPVMWSTNGWNGKVKLVGSVCQIKNTDSVFHPECLPPPHWPLIVSGIDGGKNLSMALTDRGASHHPSIYSIFSFTATSFSSLFGKAIAVAMIGYMESMTIAKTVARTHPVGPGQSTEIDPNRELVALGVCNLMCSQFSGYPVTGSFSRTAVNADSGARTQLSAAIAAAFVGFSLLVLTPILQYIPKAALASIVLVAIIKLIKPYEAVFLWRLKLRDFLVFSTVVLVTVFFGVEPALVIGILTSWVLVLHFNHPSKISLLDSVNDSLNESGKSGLRRGSVTLQSSDLGHGQIDENRKSIVVVKTHGDLSFASAASFRSTMATAVSTTRPRIIILDASSLNDVDATGIYTLGDVVQDFEQHGVLLFIAGMPLHSRQVIKLASSIFKSDFWDMTLRGEEPDPLSSLVMPDIQEAGYTRGNSEIEKPTSNSASVLFFTTIEAAYQFARMGHGL